MEVDDIQMQRCKFARIENGIKSDLNKIGKEGEEKFPDDGVGGGGVGGRFFGWPASRIVRVSKASGGKDRHSKVWTSKGLRDRRVRLSVTTAIQFYDLQDRLGYDQPSKAVEWLIKAAADSIDELPTINTAFPGTPKQVGDGKRSSEHEIDSLELELDPKQTIHDQPLKKLPASSSNSETSKGSGGGGNLSLSRTQSRDKARERAKGRKIEREKEKATESGVSGHQEMNPISQSSFTDLLSGCISNVNSYTSYFKKPQTWSSSAPPMDYFTPVSISHQSSGFSDQIQMGNSMSHHSPFSVTGDHFSFVPEHHLTPVTTSGENSDYNLNFTISSGYAGFGRGTLQSNSPSLFSNDQRVSSIDRSNGPFFVGNAAPSPASLENQHQFSAGIDGPLQLYYGNGGRNSDKEGEKY